MTNDHTQKKSKQNYRISINNEINKHFLPKPKCHSGNCTQKEIHALNGFFIKESNIKSKVSFQKKEQQSKLKENRNRELRLKLK